MRTTRTTIAVAVAVLLTLTTACSSSGSDAEESPAGNDTDTPTTIGGDDADAGDSGDGSGSSSSGSPGTLTLDGEDIELGAGRCLLEEQPSAGGGGTLEATAQASGTNAAGDEVVVDFTRYSADSSFAGDDVSVTVGDPFSADATNLTGSSDAGTVSIDGSEVSATDFEVSEDLGDTQTISFTINC